MLQPHGKRTQALGAFVDIMIKELNERYPTDETVALWYVESQYAVITPNGGGDYGKFAARSHYAKGPTILIGIKDRTQAQIAGQIAYQYANYLQNRLGMRGSLQTAAEFARHMNSERGFENPPADLARRYAERFNPAKC